jgi:hypothetical protein
MVQRVLHGDEEAIRQAFSGWPLTHSAPACWCHSRNHLQVGVTFAHEVQGDVFVLHGKEGFKNLLGIRAGPIGYRSDLNEARVAEPIEKSDGSFEDW